MNILTYIRRDDGICFGRPHIAGSGVSCFAIFNRYEAGESLEHIARGYGLAFGACREAVVFEAGRRFRWRKQLPTRREPETP